MSGYLLIQGNARHLPLADESVQCVVTSVPYWGLRAYQTTPQVWGGEKACCHDFSEVHQPAANRGGDRPCGKGEGGEDDRTFHPHVPPPSAFCRRCNAWRGELGLEPTPDCGAAGGNAEMMELRDDLSEEDREYVVGELIRRGILR